MNLLDNDCDCAADLERTLPGLVERFLTELANAKRSFHTLRAYATDLSQLVVFCADRDATLNAETVGAFFATLAHLSPTSRIRKQASIASFFAWACRQNLIDTNPMLQIGAVPTLLSPTAP